MPSLLGRALSAHDTRATAATVRARSPRNTRKDAAVHSAELEKLLNSWGQTNAAPYDAEVMIDELLASTWVPPSQRRVSALQVAASGGNATARSMDEGGGRRGTVQQQQQTQSMEDLQHLLNDSIDRLLSHRDVITNRISVLEQENQTVSGKFKQGLQQPEQLLNQICIQMEDLEERFTKVSSTAVVIGDRLSTLHQERTRVLDTDEMMDALLALNEPSSSSANSVSASSAPMNRLVATLRDKTQLHEASRVVKKMLVFSTELSSPLISVAVNEIERLSQAIENDLLTEFSDAQDKENVRVMRTCAESLIEYNDKEKVTDRYVWNVMKDRLAKKMETVVPSLGDATNVLNPDQDLDALFTTIYNICKDQFAVIENVFPPAAISFTRELLVERLFNDPAFGIFSHLDSLLNVHKQLPSTHDQTIAPTSSLNTPRRGGSVSTVAGRSASVVQPDYVRLLCTAYEQTCELALKIEMLESPQAQARAIQNALQSRTNSFNNAAEGAGDSQSTAAVAPLDNGSASSSGPAGAAASSAADRERMRMFLTLQLHSLFGSHRQRYFRTELDLLEQQFAVIFGQVRFPQPVVKTKAKLGTSRSSRKDTADTKPGPGSTVSSGGSSAVSVFNASSSLTNIVGSNTSSAPASVSSSSMDRDGGLATPEVATIIFCETLLSVAKDVDVPNKYAHEMTEAFERCEVILKDSEMRGELVTKIFSAFIAAYADEYIEKILALASEILQDPMLTEDSPRQFFVILEQLLARIDFIDDQFSSWIETLQAESPTQLTICFDAKNKCMGRIERGITSNLLRVLMVVEKHIVQTLSAAQDKSDFIGSEANMSLSCSKACKKCIDYLKPLVSVVCSVLLDENAELFLIRLGTQFKDLYLAHLTKFRFDPDGACMLLRDVNAYRQIFGEFNHEAIDDAFDTLHEVANLFAIPPENLGGFVREGKLASMSKQSLTDIIKRRWDYKTHGDKIQL